MLSVAEIDVELGLNPTYFSLDAEVVEAK